MRRKERGGGKVKGKGGREGVGAAAGGRRALRHRYSATVGAGSPQQVRGPATPPVWRIAGVQGAAVPKLLVGGAPRRGGAKPRGAD